MNKSIISEPATLIFISLFSGPRHGYAINQDIKRTFKRSLGYGTLYGTLKRLESRGLIESPDPNTTRQRPYELTEHGTKVAREEIEKMIDLALVGYKRLKSTD